MSDTQKTIQDYFQLVKSTADMIDKTEIEKAIDAFMRVYQTENTIYIFGNGGSAATSTHIAGDFVKDVSFGLEKRFKIISLADNLPALMAIANDISYDDIFIQQLKNFLQPDDLVIGISGSGNSKNVVKALQYAKDQGVQTIAFTAYKGGMIAKLSDIVIHAGVLDMEVAEDIHMMVFHIIKKETMRRLVPENASRGSVYDKRIE